MRKLFVTAFVVVSIAVLGTAQAEAGPIRISGLSCRGEWVDVKNASDAPRNLQGFRLIDHHRVHRFDFPSVRVPPGAKVRVWSNGGSGGPVTRWYTGWNAAIWSDSGENARLLNPNRDVVSRRYCDDVAPPPPPGGGGGGGGGSCTPGYSPCIAPGSDVDCAGGSGNGPRYVDGPVRVSGSDPYGLDSDNDGWGCE
ncbi:MAG TPA: lamin tail domain-containing protein [Acidimicrobiales bacterium]|nr:lamin tail domain-containing protein [Acidimicrobiales bacterium]